MVGVADLDKVVYKEQLFRRELTWAFGLEAGGTPKKKEDRPEDLCPGRPEDLCPPEDYGTPCRLGHIYPPSGSTWRSYLQDCRNIGV
ncbi:hypothetical protein JTE90_016898 [Oedothorax gibbosus]|uniref:Uncharacterized protein n=1 Tax=Oedothorax gibbosus TaxID=931172 RepID=A0AAV6TJY1_9ARAC|nr:hypothetical protein JTE90_016898 [Oedothorax gibbosus]